MTIRSAAPQRRAWRRVASWVMVVLTGLAITGSVVGLWVHRTVLDTNAFMTAVTPIVESESVRALVTDRVSDQLVDALDLETRLGERLAQAEERLLVGLADALDLSDRVVERIRNSDLGLEGLAPVVAAGVESRIRDAVATFISSPEGTRLLLDTIEVAHERSVLLLRDDLDQLPNVVVTEGEVRLNLVPVLAEVLRSLVNAGLDIVGISRQIPPFDSSEDATAAVQRLGTVLNRDLPPDFGQVRLTSEESLERAQGLVRLFDLALWALVILALVFAAVAVWTAPSVPVGLIRIGIAATLAALVGWLGVQLIASFVTDAAATAEGRAAANDIVVALADGLATTAVLLAIVGIGVVVAGFVVDRQVIGGPAAAVPTPVAAPPPAAAPSPAAVAASSAGTAATRAATSAKPARATPAKPASAKPASAKSAAAKGAPAKPASARKAPANGPSTTNTAAKARTKASPTASSDSAPAPKAPTRRRRRPPAADT
jgi:hypothetical protein